MADTSNSTLPPEAKKIVKDVAKQVIGQVALQGVIAASGALLTKLLVTSMRKDSLQGTKSLHPTKDEVVLDKKEASAKENEAALSKDDVRGQQGTLDAAETDAQASKTDARAADTGASAMQTKAGAMDVATKAMKIN